MSRHVLTLQYKAIHCHTVKLRAKVQAMPATAFAPAPRKAATRRSAATRNAAKSEPLSMRVDNETRSLIDRAATALGQTRTEFMLASARERATEVLLNRSFFVLGDSDWNAFTAALDEAPPANTKLRALLTRKAPWQESASKSKRKAA